MCKIAHMTLLHVAIAIREPQLDLQYGTRLMVLPWSKGSPV